MLSRGGLGLVSVISIIIVLGLILTHGTSANNLAGTAFSGIDNIIRDLELAPKGVGSHN